MCGSTGSHTSADVVPVVERGFAAVDLALVLEPGQPITVEKLAALYTSRDRGIGEPGEAARDEIERAGDFDDVLARHELAWDHLWVRCDVEIDGPVRAALILRLHVFHLLQTVSPHSIDLDVGIPARGLHGEAYRGHVFWDEMFVLPFLNLRLPEVARAMLLYRWRRLPQARAGARAAGHRGAMFPWQSGSTGREESQTMHLNPRSGRWLPDNSHLQRHIGLAVAYNTWRYYEATGDIDFLTWYGAELILSIATFWGDVATYDPAEDRFDICGVMGPDEYHDGLPARDRAGLDDNAYTNVMAAWTLTRALECLEVLPPGRRHELLDALDIRRADLERWQHVSRKLRLCWQDGVLLQFRGYDDAGGVRLAGLPAAVRGHQPAGPDPGGRGGLDQPLQAVQAGRRPDALPAAPRRRALRRPGPAGVSARPAHHPAHHRVLPRPDQPRVDAVQGGPLLGAGPR